MEAQQNNFEGWAVIELFGHAKAIGFVTTQAFGQAVLFRVDTPGLPERDFVLTKPAYTRQNGDESSGWTPAGSKVRRAAVAASTRLVGPGAIYSIVPCTNETAMDAIEHLIERPLILLERAKSSEMPMLLPGESHESDRCCDECGQTPEEGHTEDCSFAQGDDEEAG